MPRHASIYRPFGRWRRMCERLHGLTCARRFPRSAEKLLAEFQTSDADDLNFEPLVQYFATAFEAYRTRAGSGARFPGLSSAYTPELDALEGFSRTMPLFAAWRASGRGERIVSSDGRGFDVSKAFVRGLLAGTDASGGEYWGVSPRGKNCQRVVEAADVALCAWLLREDFWGALTPEQRAAIVDWLAHLNDRPGLDNNWRLFFVIVERVLSSLGALGRIGGVQSHWARVKDFHLGDGWYVDGPNGRVDYYNAWGFHYALYWIHRIDPDWDPIFIRDCARAFLETYRLLITPDGLPILGRSIPYRLAAAAPLVAGADMGLLPPGEARRALTVTWRHFVRRGALRAGAVTQGYHGRDWRLADRYIGPASPLWSLRSLTIALSLAPTHAFWTAPQNMLASEGPSYDVLMAGGRWRVQGGEGKVAIEPLRASGATPAITDYGLLEALRGHMRPPNMAAKYDAGRYSSDAPFCLER